MQPPTDTPMDAMVPITGTPTQAPFTMKDPVATEMPNTSSSIGTCNGFGPFKNWSWMTAVAVFLGCFH